MSKLILILRWLGLQQCFSGGSPYGWNSLQLLLKSITLRYSQEKARLVMELRDSSERAVGDIHTQVVTGRKWKNEEEVLKKKKSEGGGQPQIGRHTQPMVQIKQDGEVVWSPRWGRMST